MTQREAFEAWWGQAPVELQPLQPRTREDTLSAWVWEAWQAAQAIVQPAVPDLLAALVNIRAGMVDAKNTNIVDYIDAVLGGAQPAQVPANDREELFTKWFEDTPTPSMALAFDAGWDAAQSSPVTEPMTMALCERHSLILRVGQPYVFAPVGDCESCAELLAAAIEAYGPNAGAPLPAAPEVK